MRSRLIPFPYIKKVITLSQGLLEPCSSCMSIFSIGIDLGGTNLRIAAFTADWERRDAITVPTRVQDGPGAVLADTCAAVQKLVAGCGGRGDLVGVGLGSPGPLELP